MPYYRSVLPERQNNGDLIEDEEVDYAGEVFDDH